MVTRAEAPAFALVDPHSAGLGSLVQPGQTPLGSFLPSAEPHSNQPCVVHGLHAPSRSLTALGQHRPSAEPWGAQQCLTPSVAPFPPLPGAGPQPGAPNKEHLSQPGCRCSWDARETEMVPKALLNFRQAHPHLSHRSPCPSRTCLSQPPAGSDPLAVLPMLWDPQVICSGSFPASGPGTGTSLDPPSSPAWEQGHGHLWGWWG